MTLHIQLADREGALERLLSTCRRRGFALRSLRAEPTGDGVLALHLSLDPGAAPAERVLAVLHRIHDILGIAPATAAAAAA